MRNLVAYKKKNNKFMKWHPTLSLRSGDSMGMDELSKQNVESKERTEESVLLYFRQSNPGDL